MPPPIKASTAPTRTLRSNYPEPFATRMARREKRPLGDRFGLRNFGVNLTRIAPGGESALFHRHSRQDEFVYVLEGEVVLVTNQGEQTLRAGDCAGYPAGKADAHHFINRSNAPARYLEVGNRDPEDTAFYPDDDLAFDDDGRYVHKDGTPYRDEPHT